MTAAAPDQIEKDLRTIVGGNFTRGLGPLQEQIKTRVRGAPEQYIAAFERLYVDLPDMRTHSQLYPSAFLRLVADVAPQRVAALGQRLLSRYDTAMATTEDLMEEDPNLETLPQATSQMARRLDLRRRELRALLDATRTAPR